MKSVWPRLGALATVCVSGTIVLGMLTVWVVEPIWDAINRAERSAYLVRHYRSLIAEKPAYVAATAQATLQLEHSGALFRQTSSDLASAQLQNTMQNLTAQAGGQVQSSATGTSYITHGLQIIVVTLTLSLPANRLANFLKSVESQKPYIVVEGIDIRSSDMGNGTGPLDIQLQVNGFSQLP